MRNLRYLVLHCSATPEGRPVTAAEIKRWHKGKGWRDIGYHFVIELSGKVVPGRRIEQAGSHVQGWNAETVGICYVGGTDLDMKPKDTLTVAQEIALENLVAALRAKYGPMELYGHNDFTDTKACPSFKVSERLPGLKIDATKTPTLF